MNITLKQSLDALLEKMARGQIRDRNGRWTEMGRGSGGDPSAGGGGGGGGAGGGTNLAFTYPTTATVKRMTADEFGKNAGKDSHNKTARAITIGAINGAKGGGSSLSSVYAAVSHATGIPQGKALADAVNAHLSNMDKNGQLTVVRESTMMRHGKETGLKAGKPKWERNADGDWQVASMETFKIVVKDKALAATGSKINSPHTLGPRAARFDPVKDGLADKALKYRRELYDDTRLAPQGRFHSSRPDAPEMMFGDTRKELAEKGKISAKDAEGKVGTDIKGKYIRKEVFEAKQIDFYDATSSVTAHIGVMTGDKKSLQMSKLVDSTEKPAHHSLAQKLGVSKDKTASPYYSVLSGSKGSLNEKDFDGLKPGHIKEVSKSIWTPGSYGSKPVMGGYDSMGVKVTEKLVAGGMKPVLAKQTAQKMLDNFKESSLATFSPGFRSLMNEAPANFVYENPMSGYRLSFNKYDTATSRIRLTGADGKPVQLRAEIPTAYNKRKTASGASALFIQNWDSAVMSDLMLRNKSQHTVHDAIGIKRSRGDVKLKELQASVAQTMAKQQRMDPLKDLTKQIMAQRKKNGDPQSKLDKHQKEMDAALARLRKSNSQYKFSSNNNHFAKE